MAKLMEANNARVAESLSYLFPKKEPEEDTASMFRNSWFRGIERDNDPLKHLI